MLIILNVLQKKKKNYEKWNNLLININKGSNFNKFDGVILCIHMIKSRKNRIDGTENCPPKCQSNPRKISTIIDWSTSRADTVEETVMYELYHQEQINKQGAIATN